MSPSKLKSCASRIFAAGAGAALTITTFTLVVNRPLLALQSGSSQVNKASSAVTPDKAPPAHSPGDVEMVAAMKGLSAATPAIKMTGQVDTDFMLLMIPHHDAGIAMSSAEADFGEHKELKDMAVLDVHDQTKDNRDMRSYLQHPARANPAAAPTAETAMLAAMTKMSQSMKGMKLNGKQDHDFIIMMIPHHEAAIAMAEIELKHGSDPRVKKVAQGVFDGQSKDVRDMKKWYKEWFGSDDSM